MCEPVEGRRQGRKAAAAGRLVVLQREGRQWSSLRIFRELFDLLFSIVLLNSFDGLLGITYIEMVTTRGGGGVYGVVKWRLAGDTWLG